MERQLISSGAKWESVVGYSRAIRVGNLIEISGTTATDGDRVQAAGDVYGQTVYILEKIRQVLQEAGSRLEDVIRTRMYVTDISQWEQVAKAHGKFFGTIRPVTTMVEVSRLIQEDLLIEIEVTAIISP
ncbi:MAG: RidA family protein [Bacteroidota bacterium]|nr:RidA family protein [Bacteroidota bacterium]